MFFAGEGLKEVSDRGQPITDQSFLLLMNAHYEPVPFTLPSLAQEREWLTLVDTAHTTESNGHRFRDSELYPLQARSLVLLTQQQEKRQRSDDRKTLSEPLQEEFAGAHD